MQVIDLVKDSTMQDIANSLRKMSGISHTELADWYDVQHIVKTGNAQNAFPVGDQLVLEWTDITSNNKKYTWPLDVAHYKKVELANGEIRDGMMLVSHYTTPFGIQFSQFQAFLAPTEELPAGTYNVTMGFNWGNNVKTGKTYQFTLTQPVPAGGQLSGFERAPDVTPDQWKVKSWASNTAITPTETVVVTEGTEGTNLGTFTAAGNEQLNSFHMVVYGNNIYAHSAIRQWLNSSKGAGAWWTPQSKFDRCPDQLATKAGFLTGLDESFLHVIMPTKIVTHLNTLTPLNTAGVPTEVYDKVFLPSLEEMFVVPQLAGEGEAMDYFKIALGKTQPVAQYSTNPELIKFSVGNHNSAQNYRLRSAHRGNGYITWNVNASGNVGSSSAYNATTCTPAFIIC